MVYMYHSFLIYSSANGHLGCFHVLGLILKLKLQYFGHLMRTADSHWENLEGMGGEGGGRGDWDGEHM